MIFVIKVRSARQLYYVFQQSSVAFVQVGIDYEDGCVLTAGT